jgi:hypothetical protein
MKRCPMWVPNNNPGKKFRAFHAPESSLHFHQSQPLVLSWSTRNQTTSKSILTFFTDVRLGLPCSSFPLVFSSENLDVFHLSLYVPSVLSLSSCHPHNLWWVAQITKIRMMQFCRPVCYFLPLRSKYSPELPVFEHLHPVKAEVPYCYKTIRRSSGEQVKCRLNFAFKLDNASATLWFLFVGFIDCFWREIPTFSVRVHTCRVSYSLVILVSVPEGPWLKL